MTEQERVIRNLVDQHAAEIRIIKTAIKSQEALFSDMEERIKALEEVNQHE